MSPLWAGLVGIVGVLAGVLLNEAVRRRNRREAFAPKIFEKRLAAYEGLFDCMHECDREFSELLTREGLTKDEIHAAVSKFVFDVAHFVDAHRLYLDDDLRGHCVAAFVGNEDILSASGKKREQLMQGYNEMLTEAYRMIGEDSGIAEITKLFKSINRPKLSGPFIEAVQKYRRQNLARKS